MSNTLSSEYKIDDGIPAPAARRRIENRRGATVSAQMRGNTISAKYPWRSLAVGQSFLVVNKTADAMGSLATSAEKRINDGRRFVARKVDGGVRVWRIA